MLSLSAVFGTSGIWNADITAALGKSSGKDHCLGCQKKKLVFQQNCKYCRKLRWTIQTQIHYLYSCGYLYILNNIYILNICISYWRWGIPNATLGYQRLYCRVEVFSALKQSDLRVRAFWRPLIRQHALVSFFRFPNGQCQYITPNPYYHNTLLPGKNARKLPMLWSKSTIHTPLLVNNLYRFFLLQFCCSTFAAEIRSEIRVLPFKPGPNLYRKSRWEDATHPAGWSREAADRLFLLFDTHGGSRANRATQTPV